MNEQALLERLLNRDQSAVKEFYEYFGQRLINYIRTKVGSREDTEEIAQDVLFAFLEGARDFTGKCRLFTYLCSIANYKIIDFYRKRKFKRIVFSQLPYSLESFLSDTRDTEKDFDEVLLSHQIAAVFQKLAPHYARILKLKYVEGRSVEEIARLLSCSFKSAESVLFRARKAFVKLYAEKR